MGPENIYLFRNYSKLFYKESILFITCCLSYYRRLFLSILLFLLCCLFLLLLFCFPLPLTLGRVFVAVAAAPPILCGVDQIEVKRIFICIIIVIIVVTIVVTIVELLPLLPLPRAPPDLFLVRTEIVFDVIVLIIGASLLFFFCALTDAVDLDEGLFALSMALPMKEHHDPPNCHLPVAPRR